MVKFENSGFLETIAACDLKVGRCRRLYFKAQDCEICKWGEIHSDTSVVFLDFFPSFFFCVFNFIVFISFKTMHSKESFTCMHKSFVTPAPVQDGE